MEKGKGKGKEKEKEKGKRMGQARTSKRTCECGREW